MSDFPQYYNGLVIDGVHYHAEMTKPGYIIIRCGDEVCGDIEIDLFLMKTVSRNVNPIYPKVIDQLRQGIDDLLVNGAISYEVLAVL